MTPVHQPSRFTKVFVALVVFIGTFVLARSIYFPYTSEGQREARVRAAKIHAETIVAPLLAKEKRFEEIRVYGWWEDEGYFRVWGGVETEADLKDLKRLIMATHPPAPVAWNVEVFKQQTASTNITTKIP
jgi:hypothetical protein